MWYLIDFTCNGQEVVYHNVTFRGIKISLLCIFNSNDIAGLCSFLLTTSEQGYVEFYVSFFLIVIEHLCPV